MEQEGREMGMAKAEALEAMLAAMEVEREEERRSLQALQQRLAAAEEAKDAADRARANAERDRREVEAQALVRHLLETVNKQRGNLTTNLLYIFTTNKLFFSYMHFIKR